MCVEVGPNSNTPHLTIRLNEARLLIINCTGLAAEVAKNIVLAGVGSVTLQHDAAQPHPTTNFLLGADAADAAPYTIAQAMAAELQEMNPLVQVASLQQGDTEGDTYHAALLVVSATTDLRDAVTWATDMRAKGVKVFVASCRGTVSWFFQDLGDAHSFTATVGVGLMMRGLVQQHTFTHHPPQDKSHEGRGVQHVQFATMEAAIQAAGAVPASGRSLKRIHPLVFVLHGMMMLIMDVYLRVHCLIRSVSSTALYTFQVQHNRAAEEQEVPVLAQALQALLKDAPPALTTRSVQLLKEYVTAGEELPAVNAVLGGLLANELIKAVGGKGEPLRNFVLYSLDDGHACVECCN